jgi:Ran-binding protein 1
MADASTEPKLEQTETKPLHGDETAAEAPKETSDKPATVR